MVLSPTTPLLVQLSQYLFTLARYDQDYDVRDRGRFLNALLRGVKDEKHLESKPDEAGNENGREPEEEEADMGGVVLRREQVKVILLSQRSYDDEKAARAGDEFNVGSMSRLIGRRLDGYSGIPEWTDDPTDSSLRDSEMDDPTRQVVPAISFSSAPALGSRPVSASATPLPVHLAASVPRGGSPVGSSPVGSVPVGQGKGKFQDLDAFLNSESEESTEEESDRLVSLLW